MTYTSRIPTLSKALHEAAQATCIAYGVPKIYFAQALGRRLHHLAGFGETTYLPALKEYLGYGIWAFIEGSDRLTAERKADLLADLKQIVSTCASTRNLPRRRKPMVHNHPGGN